MSARARAVARVAMGVCVVAYVAGLAVLPDGLDPVVDTGLALLTVWLPAAVCWLAALRTRPRRWQLELAAAAVTAYAVGDTYYVLVLPSDTTAPFPSPADLAYVLFYLLVLAALGAGVRSRVRRVPWSLWLDSTVGSLGAASVLAIPLEPVLEQALAGASVLETVVAVAYPLFDVLIVASVVGIAALNGIGPRNRVNLLVLGLLAFTAADVVYALKVLAGTYAVGTMLDAAWAVGLALVALWVDASARAEHTQQEVEHRVAGGAALAVSAVATAAGLSVLVVGSRTHLPTLAITLAGITLFAAAARTQMSYRQVAAMAALRRRDATTDDLTGLPNRRALYEEGIARLAAGSEHRRALLLLDLDKFKEVNDSLGHYAGDVLLIEVGRRLSQHLRAGDLLARLGGDEFAVLLDDADRTEAVAVATKLRTVLAEPFALEGIGLHSSVSIGIALFPDDGHDLNDVLRKADIAMYRAKTSGNGHHCYSGADDADEATRLQTVDELRAALVGDQFVLHYQPKIDLRTHEINGVEALVRWQHPVRGLLPPDAFLDLVEESGLMPRLTRVVLATALDQIAVWQARGEGLTVAVNLSASSLVDVDLPDQVAAMMSARGVPPWTLQLEITEQFLMADRDRARAVLARLRQGGVQISVDDFGTGYSSLSYLQDLPIDELKLDRSFVLPMATDDRAVALVGSIIALAHSLGLRIVAEGVETPEVSEVLSGLGCDQAQGFFVAGAVPACEFDDWLATWREAAELVGL